MVVVAVIGVGAVGSTIAYALLLKDYVSEIILVDINTQRCSGEVKDLAGTLGFSAGTHIYQGTLEDARHADIIIISAGVAQKPDQARSELLRTNKKILKTILKGLENGNPKAVIIIVSNPLDQLTYYALRWSSLPSRQIFGTGTFLDTQRLKHLLSCNTGIAEESVEGYVLGEHGDSQLVAWSTVKIGARSVDYFGVDHRMRQEIAKVVMNEAYEIIKAKGATYYGIAACVATLCKMIIFDERQVVPVSWCHEQFDVCMSLPAVIGASGVLRVIEPSLTQDEQDALEQSAASIKRLLVESD